MVVCNLIWQAWHKVWALPLFFKTYTVSYSLLLLLVVVLPMMDRIDDGA
jgi:hypothetical protein